MSKWRQNESNGLTTSARCDIIEEDTTDGFDFNTPRPFSASHLQSKRVQTIRLYQIIPYFIF